MLEIRVIERECWCMSDWPWANVNSAAFCWCTPWWQRQWSDRPGWQLPASSSCWSSCRCHRWGTVPDECRWCWAQVVGICKDHHRTVVIHLNWQMPPVAVCTQWWLCILQRFPSFNNMMSEIGHIVVFLSRKAPNMPISLLTIYK